MEKKYVHGYDSRENRRLQDQANTLVELLHFDTSYPAGNRILEAGCGVGAQNGVFCYTFFKAVAIRQLVAEPEG